MTQPSGDPPWDAILAHRERPLRIARRRLPCPDDAEDVVQDAMLRCAEFDRLDLDRQGCGPPPEDRWR